MDSKDEDPKIPLPNFLKLLTSSSIPVPKAMIIAGKVYKGHNTPSTLGTLTDMKLITLGLDIKEERKAVLNALRKAGYIGKAKAKVAKVEDLPPSQISGSKSTVQPSISNKRSSIDTSITPTKRKRKKLSDVNEFLPDGLTEEIEHGENFDFAETVDEEALENIYTVINRAPVMMAWAMFVAERMHFTRDEALSIASVYTEMNAVTKGISLGIYEKAEERGREAAKNGSQPYVELMGRRVPLYRTQAGQWRALSNGTPVSPSSAYSYISHSFRQRTQHILGALKLLAGSYPPQELNQKAWSLYADFRPTSTEWGKRSEVYCKTILSLRKKDPIPKEGSLTLKPVINSEPSNEESQPKKPRTLTLEEYEAQLDLDTTFDDVDLDFPELQNV